MNPIQFIGIIAVLAGMYLVATYVEQDKQNRQ
jgi:hypothetical protein